MKLLTKLTLFITLSKLLIVILFGNAAIAGKPGKLSIHQLLFR